MKKETITLAVSVRDAKEKPNVLRKAGHVPGVVYGSKAKNTSVKCSGKDLQNVYVKAGENTLVQLDLDGKAVPCLIHAVSFDPVTNKLDHVDFYAVDMTKKVTTRVPVYLKGESPAVKTQGGIIVMVHAELEVTCLPADLPAGFTIDIASLENFHDTITVAKLDVPSGVTLKNSPETVIVTVQEPRKEEVVEVATAPAAEGAAPAEGAAAPAAEGAAPAAAPGAPAKDAKAVPAKK